MVGRERAEEVTHLISTLPINTRGPIQEPEEPQI